MVVKCPNCYSTRVSKCEEPNIKWQCDKCKTKFNHGAFDINAEMEKVEQLTIEKIERERERTEQFERAIKEAKEQFERERKERLEREKREKERERKERERIKQNKSDISNKSRDKNKRIKDESYNDYIFRINSQEKISKPLDNNKNKNQITIKNERRGQKKTSMKNDEGKKQSTIKHKKGKTQRIKRNDERENNFRWYYEERIKETKNEKTEREEIIGQKIEIKNYNSNDFPICAFAILFYIIGSILLIIIYYSI